MGYNDSRYIAQLNGLRAVFEYYISHHLGKGFESVFGGVTCLPGWYPPTLI